MVYTSFYTYYIEALTPNQRSKERAHIFHFLHWVWWTSWRIVWIPTRHFYRTVATNLLNDRLFCKKLEVTDLYHWWIESCCCFFAFLVARLSSLVDFCLILILESKKWLESQKTKQRTDKWTAIKIGLKENRTQFIMILRSKPTLRICLILVSYHAEFQYSAWSK